MDKNVLKSQQKVRRRRGIRRRIFGTVERPRMAVYRSNKQIYVQVINDVDGKTLASASSRSLEKGWNVEAAKQVGTLIAEKAKAAGVEVVKFDRGGSRYHGRVKALADAAREGGLKF